MKAGYRGSWIRGSWPVAVAVLVFAAITIAISSRAGARAPVLQAVDPSPTPSPGVVADGGRIPNPFPSTEAMTETVQEVLAAYEGNAANLTAGEVGPVAVPSHFTYVYLPLARKGSSLVSTPPTPTPKPVARADLAVTIWPSPSINVARGGTLAYEIRLKNYGSGSAKSARVTLPYNNLQMTVVDSQMTKQGDWISELTSNRVTASFGNIAPGEYRTAKIIFRVNTALVDDTVMSMRALYTWSDDGGDGSWTSNWAPVVVRSGDASAQWLWLSVDPVGGNANTTHHFYTDRFAPGEGIHTWLNTPTGVQALTLKGTADVYGRVRLDFKSTGLQPGTYSLVLYGARSTLTALATFYVS